MKLTDQQKWDEHCLLQSELDSMRDHNRPSGHCQIVEGRINADGWCKYFEAKEV